MDLKERIKQLMTEVICHLCTKEVPHKYQIQIEGTICISSDTEPPFAIQIAQLLSKAETEPRPSYERESSSGYHGDGTSPGEPPTSNNNNNNTTNSSGGKHRHHSSPADASFSERGPYRRPQYPNGAGDCPPAGPNDGVPLLSMEAPRALERMDSTETNATDHLLLVKDGDVPVVESVSPQGEIIHSTKRDSLERAPLPQKKRRRYSITQPEPPSVDDKVELDPVVSLPTKKRESARKLPSDEGIEVDRAGDNDSETADDSRQYTVKDMVRNLIQGRDKGSSSQLLCDLSKSLSAGQVKLVIPSVGSPPDTPVATPSAYDDHVFDLETPSEAMPLTPQTPLTPHTPVTPHTPLTPLDIPDSAKDLTLLQPVALNPISPLPLSSDDKRPMRPSALNIPARSRRHSSTSFDPLSPVYTSTYRSTPIPDQGSDVKPEPVENYDNKSLLTNLGHMSKEAINGLIIVDQDSQKSVASQDYVYKDEATGETLIKACDYCGKHFKYLSKLMEHIRSHTKTKPYKCSICGRTYTYKGDLTVHIRQHSLAKPYVCECGRAFASKKYLSVHQSQARIKGRHAVSKDDRMGPMFECTTCGKRFKFFSSFDLHLQTHNLQSQQGKQDKSSELYECQACKCSFQDHVMFVEHVLEHEHGNIVNKEQEMEPGKQRCQSLSSLPRDIERKRRLSERSSPLKHDVGFFRASTSGVPELAFSAPLVSPQPLGVVLGSSFPPGQFTQGQSPVLFPNVALSAPPMRMSLPATVRMSVPASLVSSSASGMVGQAGAVVGQAGAVVGQTGGKMFVDVAPGPFSPRLVPAAATPRPASTFVSEPMRMPSQPHHNATGGL